MRRKLRNIGLFIITVICILSCDLPKQSDGKTLISGENRTKDDIRKAWSGFKPVFTGNDYYITPSGTLNNNKLSAPYSTGELRKEFVQDALSITNFCRYLAGLPYNVEIDNELAVKAQYGAVLLKASNFSHTPNKPSDMTDEFYKTGKASTSSSNIAYGFSTLAYSVWNGYMRDDDAGNIPMVGHRRWILNPPLLKTGFGFAYGSMTMPSVGMIVAVFLVFSVIGYVSDLNKGFRELSVRSQVFSDIAGKALFVSLWNYDDGARNAICDSIMTEKEVFRVDIFN